MTIKIGFGVMLSAYATVGTERVILAPTGGSWQYDYEFAGRLQAAL